MSWGPTPTRLCLLSSLRECAVGDKVRFLGCVASYSTASGCVRVEHGYPPGKEAGGGGGVSASVSVDIGLVLETMRPECTRVGEWVNVMGYVAEAPSTAGGGGGTQRRVGTRCGCVRVQALLVWPTGPLDIGRYERGVVEGAG